MHFHFLRDRDGSVPSSPVAAGDDSAEHAGAARGRHPRRRVRRVAAGGVLLAAIGLGLAQAHFGLPGGQAVRPGHGEALRLLAGTRLKIGLTGMAQPRSDSRDYTADGLHIGLAEEIGRHLGAELELLPLAPERAHAALRDGEVDALLMRGLPPSLPPQAVTVLDTGFASGLNVLMRSDTGLRHWRQFDGQVLCVTVANTGAQALAHVLGARVEVFEAPAQALIAMRTGQCDAAVHDAVLVEALRVKAEWRKFSATLDARPPTPLQLALMADRPELETALHAALVALDSSANWRRRVDKWASNVAFEVFFDQIGPDCH